MKKNLSLIIVLLLAIALLVSCGQSNSNNNTPTDESDRLEETENTGSNGGGQNGGLSNDDSSNGGSSNGDSSQNGSNEQEIEKAPSQGLEFTKTEDNKGYYVSGIGTCTDTEIVIPKTHEGLPVLEIGEYALSSNENITSVIILNGVTTIKGHAFESCENLASVTIPASVTSIEYRPFLYCYRLTNITVSENNTTFKSIDGNLYSKDGKTLIQYAMGKNDASFVIPDGVTSIGEQAFELCYSIASITIPKSVSNIGSGAFHYCAKLIEVINHSSLNITKDSKENGYVAFYALDIHNGKSKIVNVNDYLFYTYDGNNYLLGYVGNKETITLPENYNAKPYEIYYAAFYNNINLTSITIPDSIKKINAYAFYYSDNIKKVYYDGDIASWCNIDFDFSVWGLSSRVTYGVHSNPLIYADEFYVKNSSGNYQRITTDLVIPNTVTEIKDFAFYGYESLKSLSFEENSKLTSLGTGAFYHCSALTSIILPDTITTVGECVFYDTPYFNNASNWENGIFYVGNYLIEANRANIPENPTIKAGTKLIAYNAFNYCNNLTDITIPSSVTHIGVLAFQDCSRLSSVTIEEGCKLSIGNYAFNDCKYLKSITIPNGVISIGEDAFMEECEIKFSLGESETDLVIPEGITSISANAFKDCEKAKSITIPSSVTDMDLVAFRECTYLTNAMISEDNPVYKSIDGNIYTKDGKTLLRYVTTGRNDASFVFIIPDEVTSIAEYAFSYYPPSNIVFGNGITEIGNIFGYYGCPKSITLGKNVTNIASSTFELCGALLNIMVDENNNAYKSIDGNLYSKDGKTLIKYAVGKTDTTFTIPNGVTTIQERAFYDAKNLINITISNSVTSIGEYTFYNCSNLENITISESVTSIGEYAFYGCSKLENITIPDGVTSIGQRTFYNCTNLTSITFGKNSELRSIGYGAFNGCSNLSNIIIPNKVTSIGESAFMVCSKLTDITIANAVTSIGNNAFWGCVSLTSITVDEDNTTYKSIDGNLYTKDGKTLLQYALGKTDTTFVVPDGVIIISTYAFRDCDSLENITIPDSVTNIEYSAFSDCNNLKIVIIGTGLENIGGCAFYGCTNMSRLNYRGTQTQWSKIKKGYRWNYDAGYFTINYNYTDE